MGVRSTVTDVLPFIALGASGLYWGSTAYVTLVEQPARLACANEVALAQWAQSARRTPRYAATALVAAAAALIEGGASVRSSWTWGAAALIAVIPWTVAMLLPDQKRLAASDWDPASGETRRILERWGRRHTVRTALGLAAFALFLWASMRAA